MTILTHFYSHAFLRRRIDNGVEIDFMDFLAREAQAAGFGPKTYAVVFLA